MREFFKISTSIGGPKLALNGIVVKISRLTGFGAKISRLIDW